MDRRSFFATTFGGIAAALWPYPPKPVICATSAPVVCSISPPAYRWYRYDQNTLRAYCCRWRDGNYEEAEVDVEIARAALAKHHPDGETLAHRK